MDGGRSVTVVMAETAWRGDQPWYAEWPLGCKAQAAGWRGLRRRAASRSSIRVRQRSSAAAAESCGVAAAAAARDCAACSMNLRRATPARTGLAKSSRRWIRCGEASGEACSRSGSYEAVSGRKHIRSARASAQSYHFARCTGTSGRSATHGTRIASATMTPCIASLSSTWQLPIAARIALGSSRGSIKVTPAADAASAHAPRARLSKCGMKPIERAQPLPGTEQHRRIAQAEGFRQAQQARRTGSADPVHYPVRVKHRRSPIATVAGAGDQLRCGHVMLHIEHRSDAEKQLGGIVVEEVWQQPWPKNGVQFIAEIPYRTAPMIELHACYSWVPMQMVMSMCPRIGTGALRKDYPRQVISGLPTQW